MYVQVEKSKENKSRTITNFVTKGELSYKKQAIQLQKTIPYQLSKVIKQQSSPVIQRITEEDMNQARIIINQSATTHGYSSDMIESIIRHRYPEIVPGNANILLLGKGADENHPYYGRLVYNCQNRNGIYDINVFHAHGGQTEYKSPRGY